MSFSSRKGSDYGGDIGDGERTSTIRKANTGKYLTLWL
jgi:hypothetical protein